MRVILSTTCAATIRSVNGLLNCTNVRVGTLIWVPESSYQPAFVCQETHYLAGDTCGIIGDQYNLLQAQSRARTTWKYLDGDSYLASKVLIWRRGGIDFGRWMQRTTSFLGRPLEAVALIYGNGLKYALPTFDTTPLCLNLC